MKKQIKHLSLWVILLLFNVSLVYADAPPAKPLKTLSKKEIRLQKRLKRREARKLRKRARKIKRVKRFLNSRLGKWMIKKALRNTKKKVIDREEFWKASLILLAIGVGLLIVFVLILGSSPGLAGLAALPFGILGLAFLFVSFIAFLIGLFGR